MIMLLRELESIGSFLDPWKDFERMNRSFFRNSLSRSREFPLVNVWRLDKADIEITVVGKNITLRGSRTLEELSEGESYHRKERWYGKFSRTIEMPFVIDADKVSAQFKRGILNVHVERAEADKPRKISIKSE
jgi:HSP20 family protein